METVNAYGASGALYTYQVLEGQVMWHDVPANYMVGYRGVGGGKITYVGQCDSAKSRLSCH